MQYYYPKPLSVNSNQYIVPELSRGNNFVTCYNVVFVEAPSPPPYILMPTFRQMDPYTYDQY